MFKASTIGIVATLLISSAAMADPGGSKGCGLSPSIIVNIQKQLIPVTHLADANGGIFKPNRMWAAWVD